MAITNYDSALGRNVTTTAAYPSVLQDYDNSIVWNGTLPTSTNGSAQCIARPTGTTQLFPSHPFLPDASSRKGADPQDQRGWLYSTVWAAGGQFSDISTLFPGFAPLSCTSRTLAEPEAAQPLFTASFTTVTSVCYPFARNTLAQCLSSFTYRPHMLLGISNHPLPRHRRPTQVPVLLPRRQLPPGLLHRILRYPPS